MSPGGTMMRVYASLKARIMAGEFSPGERLDPTRLSVELAASVTPIRDALHRLTGERLVDSWQHEGFRQPLVSEAGLRDLHLWTAEVSSIVLRAAQRAGRPAQTLPPRGEFADDLAALLASIADVSSNHEHRAAVATLNDRCHRFRLVEAQLDSDAGRDLPAIAAAAASGQWSAVRRGLDREQREAMRRIPGVAALLRPREG